MRPDLQERVLQVELEEISKERRLSERELFQRFNEARPAIFTALLDALSRALRDLPNTKLNEMPRMADATLWATAGETALGFASGAFIAAYRQNLDEGAATSVEASPIGTALWKLVSEYSDWGGTMAELLQALSERATEDQRRGYGWPKNPRSLGHYLRRIAPALRRSGMACEFERSKQSRIVNLRLVTQTGDANDANDANFPHLRGELGRPEGTILDRTAKGLAITRAEEEQPEVEI